MKKQEKELFKALCSFKAKEFDEGLLQAANPIVLGHLFFNRMQAVAYGVLKKHNLLGKVNREFRNSLKGAYEQNLEKNRSFFWCINHVEEALSGCDCKYAMLKGAYLCRAYPEGYRTSNDIDLLVHPKDVTEVGNALLSAGFKQGNVRNGSFIPATRKEIIESKMMRGETVPYIKEVNLPGMQFLEVDINFSLDYKLGDITTSHLIHPDNWMPYAPSGITRNEIAVWQYGINCHPIEDDMGKVTTFNLNLVRNEQVIVDKMF